MYLAVDIGATKVLMAVFTNDGKLLERTKFPTGESYAKLIDDLKTEFKKLKQQDFQKAVIAVPGLLDRQAGIGIAFGNRPWKNVPIRDDTEQFLNCPVLIENDAKLAALSEALLIINDFKKVLYVTISTGISAGLIVNGVIDPNLANSESGHMRLEHNGKLEKWQDFASGRAIVAKYGQRASEITDKTIWKAIAKDITVGLIDLIAVIQPEVIILGGGVGAHFDKFEKPLIQELNRYSLPLVPIPPIRMAQNPEEAVIYGCYSLAKRAEMHDAIA